MIIIIKQLPSNSSAIELHNFVRPALKGHIFRRTVPVQKLEIIKIHDVRHDTDEYHGLVHIDSQPAAERAIKKLDGRFFNSTQVSVKEYFPVRKSDKDRRSREPVYVKYLPEKRQAERRRSGELLEIEVCSSLYRSKVFY